MKSYILISDAPPTLDNGSGSSVLAINFIKQESASFKLVLTRRLSKRININKIADAVPTKTIFYPDTTGWPLLYKIPFLKAFIEIILFIFSLPTLVLVSRAKAVKADSILGFCGADVFFLLKVYFFSKARQLPYDLYLVDDFEESHIKRNSFLPSSLINYVEKYCLSRAKRIFVISQGYKEHLFNKLDLHAEWLPYAFSDNQIIHYNKLNQSSVRYVTYIGSINYLYEEALFDSAQAIQTYNQEHPETPLILRLICPYDPITFITKISALCKVDLIENPNHIEIKKLLSQSWCCLLPYSHALSEKIMVSTSFSTKLSDYLLCGRPIVVYGPAYASIPRLWIEKKLPLCATNKLELNKVFETLNYHDQSCLIQSYNDLIIDFAQIRKKILEEQDRT